MVSKLGFPLVRYPLTFDDEDLEGIEGWIQCALATRLHVSFVMDAVLIAHAVCQACMHHAEHHGPGSHSRHALTFLTTGQTCEQRHLH